MEHPVRLDLLARLDRRPLTLAQLSARIGKDQLLVAYHVQVLASSGLVSEAGDDEDRQTLYVARLKRHPCWVARAVNEYTLPRRGSKPA